MPNNKKKSLKQIKGWQEAHPFSRKAKQVVRVLSTKNKTKTVNPKLLFFKQNILETEHLTIMNYINRNDDEIEKLQKKNHPKVDILNALKQKELKEYAMGFELPKFTADNLSRLAKWNGLNDGEIEMTTIKMVSQ
jgi:translation machinery-associated protein 16